MIVAIAAAVLALGAFAIIRGERQNNIQNISIDIDREGLAYIIGSCGLGPTLLNYSEHQEMIDCVTEMVSGEYAYKKTWSNYGRSGGGPHSISFLYTAENDKEYTILYADGCIAISAGKKYVYYLYEKISGEISFDDFEDYLRLHGEFVRGFR